MISLEEIVQLEFAVESPAQLIVIDEVGKIELYSQHFVDRVRSILDSDIPVLGTVAIRGEGLIAEVKSRPDTELIEVNDDNRDELPRQIAEQLSTLR